MKNFHQQGGRETWNNGSGADVASGAVVGPFGTANLFGVAVTDIPDGGDGAIHTAGVHELSAAAIQWAHGDQVFWDAAADNVTNTDATGTNQQIGRAAADHASTDATAIVLLNSSPLPRV